MQKKPYLIDAVIGNSRMLAALDRRGQLHRLWWPGIDRPQHVEESYAGVYVHGKSEKVSWLHQEPWQHQQSYLGDTPILQTRAYSPELQLEVTCEDEMVPQTDVMMRHYTLVNRGTQEHSLTFLYYSSMQMGENPLYNTTMFDFEHDALVHYRHQYAVAVSASEPVSGYQAGNVRENIEQARLNGNPIDMQKEGGLSWSLGAVGPGESKQITLFFAAGDGPDQACAELCKAVSEGREALRRLTLDYWKNYLDSGKQVRTGNEAIDRLYRRSLIIFRLMMDEKFGSVIAAPELDEEFSRCGGYAYCWGRDAAYIIAAVDRAGYPLMGHEFYRWTLKTQSGDGSWQQRHYLDGRLAPQWGLQMDETGSILWGMWQHYLMTGEVSFLEEVWPAVKKGAQFLVQSIDPETGLPLPSRDLWEERDGEHTYTAAAVYGGLTGAAEIARALGREELSISWRQAAENIRAAISGQLWNEERQAFFRGLKLAVSPEQMAKAKAEGKRTAVQVNHKGYRTHMIWEDPVIDASLLGVSVPFALFPAEDERAVKTADAIERSLTSQPIGGIKRYEDDKYIGGNPWILTTLWLAMYRVRQGQTEQAVKWLNWAVDHRTQLDLLPEQIDRHTGEAAWVVPLTWSHAMFVLTVLDLMEAGVFKGKS
ncbi:glycoside hydrolase family 15 protein [Paenactinomyces guangxiensis]|uniref:Glycoside hydrolase family 15 n=1 Tax=Paenactinomyces guangxiensis TaxID=1490290 RepID=A0A7W2A767_9BACL|nr:glycoside hydrolase family 15 protein [Paenactinomyces guangxiensis]MBA4493235.1 glycoside hydrolase family 15 [Paenactinomyces guangxiensis]MBH8589915.1 glycoside hydrolase family 15 [Paenactinomyces guangxiensis]